MADSGYPNNPIIRVIHQYSDVDPAEPGMVSRHDVDAEPYYYGPPKQ